MDLKAKVRELLDKMDALLATAKEEGRPLTDEELVTYNGYEVEVTNMEKTIEIEAKAATRVKADKTPVTPIINAEPNTHKPIWSHSGELLVAVANASTGKGLDKRLVNAATGSNEGVGSEGGFLVDTQIANTFIDKMHGVSEVASRAFNVPIGAGYNGIKINGFDETSRVDGSRWGGVQAYWAAEAGTVTATKPTFNQPRLDLEKLLAFYYATSEVLQDSTALGALAERAFINEMAFKVDDAYVNGDGAGKPLGYIKSSALVTVAKETGQAADTIVFENIVKMWSRMWAPSRKNAVWYINQDCEPQLYALSLAVGTGGVPVYMPANGLSGEPYGTLFGRPVIPIEMCTTVGDKGDIALVDMGQYLEIDKGGVERTESIHVRFLYDESCFRFSYRVNGMPLWNSALTPYKGSNTLSPFVTLAARA
jgi:HK97 family phage major capsid protein